MAVPSREIYQFGEFELNAAARSLARAGRPVALGSKAFDVLLCLVQHAGQVVTKADLLRTVWPDSSVEEGNLSQNIFALRKALGDHADYILTIPGRGYQFVATVREVSPVAGGGSMQRAVGGGVVRQMQERAPLVLEKAPAEKPVAAEVSAAQHPIATPRRRTAILTAAAVLLLAIAAGAWWKLHHPRATPRDFQRAVLADFVNTTTDTSLDRALKRALEIDLEQSPYMELMSDHDASNGLKMMGRDGDAAVPPEVARELCQRSNRQVLLTPGISSVGSDYLVTLDATDCYSGKTLSAAKAEAPAKESVLHALDVVAEKVRAGLGESSQSLSSYQVPLLQATTPSLDALKNYSMGTALLSVGRDADALPYLKAAVQQDPQFAMAYSAMGTAYYNLNEYSQASQYYRQAYSLRGRVGEREKLIIGAHFAEAGGTLQGIDAYKAWAAVYPHDMTPLLDLCNAYTQIGQYAPAVQWGERALAVDPDRALSYTVLMRAYKRANRLDDASRIGTLAVQRGKDSAGLHAMIYTIAFVRGDGAAVQKEIAWSARQPEDWYFVYTQGEAAASAGKLKQSQQYLQKAAEIAQRQGLLEAADSIRLDEAAFELQLGLPGESRKTLALLRDAGLPFVQMDAANGESADLPILRAQLGDAAFARRSLATLDGTSAQAPAAYVALPRLRAAIAEAEGNPAEALAALSSTAPYELADFAVPSERGAAFLRMKDGPHAAAEYRKVLENAGIDPISPLFPLARLGLARALAISGKRDQARAQYQLFLAGWPDADPGLPVVQQARKELAAL
jgi:DNA-binding winged helix-turn-helix (wHTH) protein/tetratricopeptide (TPR) repeat protein